MNKKVKLHFFSTESDISELFKSIKLISPDVLIIENTDEIKVDVRDNGVGFDVLQLDRSVRKTGGFGLFHARERIEYIGGAVVIKSHPNQGTQITITVPTGHSTSIPVKKG